MKDSTAIAPSIQVLELTQQQRQCLGQSAIVQLRLLPLACRRWWCRSGRFPM